MENFSMMEFNYFDVTISAIIIILGIKGFMQGFIKEIFGLLGLVALALKRLQRDLGRRELLR